MELTFLFGNLLWNLIFAAAVWSYAVAEPGKKSSLGEP
jgi:hypothetical protein